MFVRQRLKFATSVLCVIIGSVAAVPSDAATVSTDFLYGAGPIPVPSAAYAGDPLLFASFFLPGTFSGFDPTLGNLTAVNISISSKYVITEPTATNFSITLSFSQGFFFPFVDNHILNTSATTFPATIPFNYSLATITDPLQLAGFLQPTLSQTVLVKFNEAGLVVPLSTITISGDAHIVYEYTPASVSATPLPSTLPLFLSVVLGVGGLMRRQKRKFHSGRK